MVSAPEEMARYDLRHYDGVLAFGQVLSRAYLERGLTERAWTFHEAADTRLFDPRESPQELEGDLVWIGNWGDEERSSELEEFLLGPVERLGIQALVHGVRYPPEAKAALARAGIRYGGWLPNHRVPETFARFRATVHVPRRLYQRASPGIPTIRVFEALAAGIPLISSPWSETEQLFRVGRDFLQARTGRETERHLEAVLHDRGLAQSLAENGRRQILARHTCAHRARELVGIFAELSAPVRHESITALS